MALSIQGFALFAENRGSRRGCLQTSCFLIFRFNGRELRAQWPREGLRSEPANRIQWHADFNLTLMPFSLLLPFLLPFFFLARSRRVKSGEILCQLAGRAPGALFSLINNCYTALLAPPWARRISRLLWPVLL